MKLPKLFRPELLVAASDDPHRKAYVDPFLCGDTIVATDGRAMGIFPCQREANDRDGIIPLESLRYARKAGRSQIEIDCGDRFAIKDGASFPRPEREPPCPNIEQVTPKEGEPARVVVGAARLQNLLRALGADLVEIEVRGAGTPLVVRPVDAKAKRALGLIMTGAPVV